MGLEIQRSVCGQIVHRCSLHCGIRALGDAVAPTEKKNEGWTTWEKIWGEEDQQLWKVV